MNTGAAGAIADVGAVMMSTVSVALGFMPFMRQTDKLICVSNMLC